jgi:excisionase family DNA binding protein
MAFQKRYLDSEAAAEYLGFREGKAGAAQIRQMVHRNEIPHYKLGVRLRFDRLELDAWMAKQRVKMREMKAKAEAIISPDDRYMTIDEAARYLRLPFLTFERLVCHGTIPYLDYTGLRLRHTLRFDRKELDAWAQTKRAQPQQEQHIDTVQK